MDNNNIPDSIIISFDIGKVHMACCVVKVKNDSNDKIPIIERWFIKDVSNGDSSLNLERVCSCCVEWLKRDFNYTNMHDNKNTWVLVERQRPINPDAFAMSYTVFTYFLTKFNDLNVAFVSPKSKPIKEKGKKRKRGSVATTKGLLTDLYSNDANTEWMSWYNRQPKKDDLADAFLQIVGNLDKLHVYKIEPEVVVIDTDEDD